MQLDDLYERKARAFARRPGMAATEHHGQLRFDDGMAACFDHPEHPLVIDLPSSDGGSGRGPAPMDLAVASLGACFGACARIWAARFAVPILDLNVALRIEHDARAVLVADDSIAAHWQRLIVETTVRVPAPLAAPSELERVFAVAAARCPLLASLHPAIERAFHLMVLPPPSSPGGDGTTDGTAVPSDITP